MRHTSISQCGGTQRQLNRPMRTGQKKFVDRVYRCNHLMIEVEGEENGIDYAGDPGDDDDKPGPDSPITEDDAGITFEQPDLPHEDILLGVPHPPSPAMSPLQPIPTPHSSLHPNFS